MRSFMFDTNIFNHVLDGRINLARFIHKAQFFATHIQFDELNKTRNEGRRANLLDIFERVPQMVVSTKTFVLDTSSLDRAEVGKGTLYRKIKCELNQLNKGKPNNVSDALIAETATKSHLILVTDDCDLSQVARQNEGSCMTLKDFLTAI